MKKMLSFVFAVMLVCGSAACAQGDSFDFGSLFGSLYNGSSSMMPKNVSMPDQFSIAYEYTDSGKFRQVLMEKDKAGNYHYKDSSDEFLFIKDGKGYRIAVSTVNGFAYKDTEKYSFDYVKSLTGKFWECAAPLDDDITLGSTTSEGQGQICGRKTDKFKVDLGMGYSIGGYSVSMSEATYYEFDRETGICLASSMSDDVSFMGINAGDDDLDGFECVRFELRDVSLPSVN